MAKPPILPSSPPLEIKVPAFQTKVLSNGMKVLFLRDEHLPLVSAHLYLQGGFFSDPPGKEGLVSLMNTCLRIGGSGKLTPEEFDEALENKAASMSASSEQEAFTASFDCLSGDLPDILGLFADMLLRPRFDEKRLETAKANLMDSLARLQDTPDTLTRVLFAKSLFGHSLYGRWASPKTVAGLGRGDVAAFYKKVYGPRDAVLAVAGKFDEDKVFARLEELFGGWKNSPQFTRGEGPQPLGPAIYFFPKDVSQVFIRFGVPGLKRHDLRFFPLEVANNVLGGSGFTSRLMQKIRSDKGLAYFVGSIFMPYDIEGPFQVVGGTRPDAVQEYLGLMFKMISDFSKEGPTARELSEAKQSMIEEFAYNFESPHSLAAYKASLDFHHYPATYLKTYRDKVKAVTREKAAEAARSILSRKDWVLVVCGPANLEPALAGFGKVYKVKDIFDPLPPKP